MKLFIGFVVFTCLVSVYALSVEEQWTNFKVCKNSLRSTCNFVNYQLLFPQNLFGRKYNEEENKTRFAIFKKNVALIEEQNAKFARGESDFGANINELSDHTPEEYKQREGSIRPVPAQV